MLMAPRRAEHVPWRNPAELEEFAAHGDVRACALLGEMCLRGDGVAKDVRRALALLEQAARGDVADAAFRLGMIFDDGAEGVPPDHARALVYFRAAAAGGAVEAMHNVGAAYASARGVPRDYAEGLAWLILARENGAASADAEQKVRDRILLHQRVDWISAAESRAVMLKRVLGAKSVGEWLTTPVAPSATPFSDGEVSVRTREPSAPVATSASRVVPLDIKPREFTPRLVRELTARSAEENAGGPVKRLSPSKRLLEWPSLTALERAARTGEPAAQYVFGQMLVEGDQVPEDTLAGVLMLERSVNGGDTDAAQKLAELYHRGGKLVRDDERAFVYTLQAARGGSPSAMFNVGSLYSTGEGVAANYVESLAWFIVARQHRYDRGGEKRVRDYLSKTAPAQVAEAEKRAAEIESALVK